MQLHDGYGFVLYRCCRVSLIVNFISRLYLYLYDLYICKWGLARLGILGRPEVLRA